MSEFEPTDYAGYDDIPADMEHHLDVPDTGVESESASSHSILPHSVEAEQSVLGGLLQEASNFDSVSEILSEKDFFKAPHRKIFRAMAQLMEREQPIDVITVSEFLSAEDELVGAGGLDYLSDLATEVPSSANVVAYAKIVRERATLRQLISAATEIDRKSVV